MAINSLGHVTGWGTANGQSAPQAFFTNGNGTLTNLGTLGSDTMSYGWGIDDRDEVVGESSPGSNGRGTAFFWSSGAGTVPLSTLVLNLDGRTLNAARAITGNGQYIVGWGTSASGSYDAFLLTSVLPGDANLDGQVDVNDLTIVLSNFGQSGMTWSQGDFNGDGRVDINDLTILLSDFGKTYGAAGVNAVPEPGTLLYFVAGLASLLVYAFRKRTGVRFRISLSRPCRLFGKPIMSDCRPAIASAQAIVLIMSLGATPLSAASMLKPTPDEMAEARRFVAAKFESPQLPAPPEASFRPTRRSRLPTTASHLPSFSEHGKSIARRRRSTSIAPAKPSPIPIPPADSPFVARRSNTPISRRWNGRSTSGTPAQPTRPSSRTSSRWTFAGTAAPASFCCTTT